MSLLIKTIQVMNYKSLKNVSLDLDDYIVLFGKNNCGKSSLLEAITLAFTYSSIKNSDVHDSLEDPSDESKKIIINVMIVPSNDEEEFSDEWTKEFGKDIGINPETDNNFFAFQTKIEYDPNSETYKNKKYVITEWNDDAEKCIISQRLNRDSLENINCLLINAQRDIVNDINNSQSILSQLFNNLKLPSEFKKELGSQLEEANSRLIGESEELSLIQNELKGTSENNEEIEISTMPKDIESLSNNLNIYYKTKYSRHIPIENLGLGVRSWAVFSSIKASDSIKHRKKENKKIPHHSLTLIEEPESHIHPQAQRKLLNDLISFKGQKIITTHSPYILSQIPLNKMVYVKKEESSTFFNKLNIAEFSNDEILKINRAILNTRGELLFSNVVILSEGETEEYALSIFFNEYFNKKPFELCCNIVGVGGKDNYKPFIRLLEEFNIKWYIFSDGEQDAINSIQKTIEELFDEDYDEYNNIHILSDFNDFESYLANEYPQELIEMINKEISCEEGYEKDYFGDWRNKTNGQQKGKNKYYDYNGEDGKKRAVTDYLKRNKVKYGKLCAESICKLDNEDKRIPTAIKKLFDNIRNDKGLCDYGN
ncbi:MAG: AAA family ATPase [Methanobrevibacter sp.]|nr:AAA family ATPase [Candidatus Methanoflexus mossambicus]